MREGSGADIGPLERSIGIFQFWALGPLTSLMEYQ